VLNASSVVDGCRVLVANVGKLPAAAGANCNAATLADPAAGPVSAAIDPLVGLYARERMKGDEEACPARPAGMRAVTAALLSARFPFVSPSGALLRCLPAVGSTPARHLTTYTVDGGYYENSGLVTLLQLWIAVDARVRDYNEGHPPNPIVPWVVVADNHYRSGADVPEVRRPFELIVPLRAQGNNGLLGQAGLEQAVASALGYRRESCTAHHLPGNSAGCLVVLAPSLKPSVAAPLGWVLSRTSRNDLDRQLVELLHRESLAGAPLSNLVRLLTEQPDSLDSP
jgi:hypothetical protein